MLNSTAFHTLDIEADRRGMKAAEKFNAQIILSVQLFINNLKPNTNWLEWTPEEICAHSQRASSI